MKLFNSVISIMFTSSLVYTTAAAESVGPVPQLPKRLITLSQDPNLQKNSNRSKTEADFCTHCANQKATTQNQKDIKAVHDTIKDKTVQQPTVKHVESAGKWNAFPEVMKYSEGKDVASAIAFAMKKKYAKSQAYCYRSVKRALVASGIVEEYPPGEHAKQAVNDLKDQGLINMLEHSKYKKLLQTPDDAPKGAILVYANNTKESGDTQIKTDWGSESGFVNDFYSNNSFLESPKARRYDREGKPYKIIGVMIKP
ncbi:MAG: hypothetical protein ACKOX6_11825 [Bdellovibrio sp.]